MSVSITKEEEEKTPCLQLCSRAETDNECNSIQSLNSSNTSSTDNNGLNNEPIETKDSSPNGHLLTCEAKSDNDNASISTERQMKTDEAKPPKTPDTKHEACLSKPCNDSNKNRARRKRNKNEKPGILRKPYPNKADKTVPDTQPVDVEVDGQDDSKPCSNQRYDKDDDKNRARRNKTEQPDKLREPDLNKAGETEPDTQPVDVEVDGPDGSKPCSNQSRANSSDQMTRDLSGSSMVSSPSDSSLLSSRSASLLSLSSTETNQSESGSGYVCVNSSHFQPTPPTSGALLGIKMSSASLQSFSSVETDQSESGSGYVCVNSSHFQPTPPTSGALPDCDDKEDTRRKDFVILNTSEDEEEAAKFKKHLETCQEFKDKDIKTVTVSNNSTEASHRSLVLMSGSRHQDDNLADSNTGLANNNAGEPKQDVNLQPSVQLANQDLDMARNIISSSNFPPDRKANSNTDVPSENNTVEEHEVNQKSAQPETLGQESHGTKSSGYLTSTVQPLSDMERDVEMDAAPVSPSSPSESTLASSLSAMSISPTENSGPTGGILDNNQTQSSSGSENFTSRTPKTGDDNQGKKMKDFVIINHEDSEDEAYVFKTHLKSDDIRIPDLTVDMFCCIGTGQTYLSVIEDLSNEYNFILIYVTKIVVDPDDKNAAGEARRLKFYSHILIEYGFDNDLSNKVIPVWTYKSAKEECKRKGNASLGTLKGLPYWRFTDNKSKELYIESVQNLVMKGREIQS